MPSHPAHAGVLEAAARRLVESRLGLPVARSELVAAHTFNAIVRVATSTGDLAVRIGDGLRIHPDGTEQIEAEWLTELARAGFEVPVPIPSADGSFALTVKLDDNEALRTCSVFRWVDGTPLGDHLEANRSVDLGSLAARLHDHAGSFVPATAPAAISFDRAVYFPLRKLVGRADTPHADVLRAAADWAQQTIESLWRTAPDRKRLLHGDLGPHNILVVDGQLVAIDFQDVRFGFPIQDLAITVADLSRRQPDAIEPFVRGYRTVRTWPSAPIETWHALVAARSLNIINLSFHLQKPGWNELTDRHIDVVRACVNHTWPLPSVAD